MILLVGGYAIYCNRKMLGLFSGNKNSFVGIDFGTSAIKVVELSYKNQKPYLENYGMIDLDSAIQIKDPKEVKLQSYEDNLRTCLQELCASLALKNVPAFISLPGYTGLITLIEFPEMSPEELENAIQFEAHKYIPSSVEEIAMSWEIVGREGKSSLVEEDKNKTPKIQVLLVAAPKKEIMRYERLIEAAGLSVGAIELETFSIARSLVGDDVGNSLIIDIGSRSTNIIFVEKGVVKVNRNIDVGSSEITKTISESMNISKQRAESFKKGDKDVINSKESNIVVPMLELISGEALRVINSYKQRNSSARIDTAILSGGTAHMKGIDEYFTQALQIKTVVGNPWRRIVCADETRPFVEKMGASFSVALGLALRGIEDFQRK